MSTTPGDRPAPPPAQPSGSSSQLAGQQSAPQTPAAGARYNTLAIVSLAAGIASFVAHVLPVIGGTVVALVAVITGYMARKQIKETGEQGMGIATAGMIIGIAHLLLIVLFVIVLLFLIFAFGLVLFSSTRH